MEIMGVVLIAVIVCGSVLGLNFMGFIGGDKVVYMPNANLTSTHYDLSDFANHSDIPTIPPMSDFVGNLTTPMSDYVANLTYHIHLDYGSVTLPVGSYTKYSILNLTNARVDGLAFVMRDTGEKVNFWVDVDGLTILSDTGYTWDVGRFIGVYGFRIIWGSTLYFLEGYDVGYDETAGTMLGIAGLDIKIYMMKTTDNSASSYVDWRVLYSVLG